METILCTPKLNNIFHKHHTNTKGDDGIELDDLIKEIDIVEYISQFVELEQRDGEYWGLSPFTNEKTPSFSIRKEAKRFYDFSSGKGGNVFSFVKYYNECSSKEAIKILKKFIGCGDVTFSPKQRMSATVACRKYKKQESIKKPSKAIVTYSDNYMERFEKQDEKLAVWRNEGISDSSLEKFNIRYDSYSNRLVYPIYNLNGKIINIGGRTIDPRWKEKNLRKYTYFSGWGEFNIIYGLFENMEEIRKKHEIILFEGCKSVLLADSWGIYNTGALLTSHLSVNQKKLLAWLGCRVVFALDKEVDIHNDRNINSLKRYVNIEYLQDNNNLIGEKDAPVDNGQDVFRTLYEQRQKFNT